jgi:hypothetical protein
MAQDGYSDKIRSLAAGDAEFLVGKRAKNGHQFLRTHRGAQARYEGSLDEKIVEPIAVRCGDPACEGAFATASKPP